MAPEGYRHVIVTLGPTSLNEEVLKKLGRRRISFVRINLSHTKIDDLEETVAFVRKHCAIPLMLDTEGSQVRTGVLEQPLVLRHNQGVLVSTQDAAEAGSIPLRPDIVLSHLREGDVFSIDFDSAVLRVDDTSGAASGRVDCTVMSGGMIQSNKAVTVTDQRFSLPALSEKDIAAVRFARQHGLDNFCLSFTDTHEDVLALREEHPDAFVMAKIETRQGIHNLDAIMREADALLLDRGDMSREVPVERVPFVQKHVVARGIAAGVSVFIATNFLDTMMEKRTANRAETNDIVNTLLDGASGLVLAAETAIGKYPVEAASFLLAVCDEVSRAERDLSGREEMTDVLKELRAATYITSPALGCGLITPHGGVLIDQRWDDDVPSGLPELELTLEEAMDVEQIALGGYSPLRGFLDEEALESVLATMRLPDGTAWPLPVLLRRNGGSGVQGMVRLTHAGEPIGLLEVAGHFDADWGHVAKRLYGTRDPEHPGVRAFLSEGDTAITGRVWLTHRGNRPGKRHELTPAQTRRLFEARGWTRVVGFHTRNAPHRAHEYIMEEALRRTHADGIFIHPPCGTKKKGDLGIGAITAGFLAMIDASETLGEALFAMFPTYSRYCGPREALFTAVCRQNYGCSHFIVGRDHTGVGQYYPKAAAQEVFQDFPDLGIEPVMFGEISYSRTREEYGTGVPDADALSISGTEARKILMSGERPPPWYQRTEVADEILRLKSEAFVM